MNEMSAPRRKPSRPSWGMLAFAYALLGPALAINMVFIALAVPSLVPYGFPGLVLAGLAGFVIALPAAYVFAGRLQSAIGEP